MAIKRVFQKEPVLSIAACLALVSSCFVLPDAEYLGYIDFRTLAILFSLMTVMAGLRGQGVFDRLGRALLSHTRTTLQLTAVLVGLCFFSSMVITNDVSLLTFVPFTFVVVNSLDAAVRDKLLLPIVCMQTIAANLGSMLTPLGNPQNLYLYGKSGMDMGSFVLLMLPYSILSLALLALWAVGLCRRGAKISMAHSAAAASPNKALLSLYSILFVLCLLVVLRVLPYGIAFAAVLACVLLADRNTLCRVDYSLILTFVMQLDDPPVTGTAARRVPSSHKQYCTVSAACFWRSCKKQQHARTAAQVQTVRACFTLSERANASSLRSGDSCRR